MREVVLFLLVGRLAIFIVQKFPFQKTFMRRYMKEGKFLKELLGCSLCLGVWVYAALGYFLHVDFITSMFGVRVLVIDEVLTGAIASFVVYIFEIGWNTRFGIIQV